MNVILCIPVSTLNFACYDSRLMGTTAEEDMDMLGHAFDVLPCHFKCDTSSECNLTVQLIRLRKASAAEGLQGREIPQSYMFVVPNSDSPLSTILKA